jgi:hypothetical protein
MRACAGWRSSDRQNSRRTSVEVLKSDWKIVKADQDLENTQLIAREGKQPFPTLISAINLIFEILLGERR